LLIWTSSQIGQNGQWGFSQVKHLIKMANVIIVKWGILPTYLPYSTTFLPTYLLQPTYLPTYQPIYPPTTTCTYVLTYWPTDLLTILGIQHILFNQMDKF